MKRYILFLLISILIVSCTRTDMPFRDTIEKIEANPEAYLEKADTQRVADIVSEKDATIFLLLAWAKRFANRNYYPEKEKLQKSIRVFEKKGKVRPHLAALYLLAQTCKKEKKLTDEIATVEKAIALAQKGNDKEWLFYLYSHLGDMYIRKYNMLKFVKYQTLANQCVKDLDVSNMNIHARIQIAKSFLYVEQYAKANALLQAAEKEIDKRHACYSDCKRLLGVVLFRLGEWTSCIEKMQESLDQEDLRNYKFVCCSILTYCYYHTGDLQNAERYQKMAASYDVENETDFTEIEFYKLCADFAHKYQKTEEQIACQSHVIERYESVVKELSGQSLDEAIQAYTHLYEKRQLERRIRSYQYAAFGLILVIAISAFVHVNRKKKQAYQLLSLQRQIHALEELKAIKDETKSFILRDMEIAKHISMLKHTRKEKSEKLLKELDKFNLLEGNNLLNTRWEEFYRHIDITFDDFHSKLTSRYPSLNEKEIQLCCLMTAGFRTEEIAAVWMQSVYTVHKYKTSIRKKIHASEAADIVVFLKEKLAEEDS